MTNTKFKIIFFLIFFLSLLFAKVFAQTAPIFRLKGNLTHMNHNAVEGATLSLKDGITGSTLQQQQSSINGQFSFAVKSGSYVIAVSYMGSLAYQSDLLKITGDRNLGTLKIETSARTLKEIIIQGAGSKTLIKVEGRKMIYDIGKSITAQGTNALEAIQKTPGVMVNQDNSITLNGASAALVMINGRQTYLQADELAQLLKTIPASDMKSIEIIKNPSSAYDAAGTGGVINLVLQKSIAEGFNGSMNSGMAYGISLKQNTNINLNFRKGKVNMFGTYHHSFGHYAMDYDYDRTTNGKIYRNTNHDVDKRRNMGSTAGIDFAIDTTKTLGMVWNGNFSRGGGLITPTTHIYDELTAEPLQTLISESDYPHQVARRYNVNFNYRYKGSNQSTLDIDADYGVFNASTKNLSSNTFYSPDGTFQSANNFMVSNNRNFKMYAIKADYGLALGKGKLLTGTKFSNVHANNIFNHYDNNVDINTDLSNTFKYKEQISAAYLRYELSISQQLNLDIGLRIENTHAEGNLEPLEGSSQLPTVVIRNYLNIFPTAAVTYKTNEQSSFTLSYARRINRPAYNSLNPFSYPIDELSYWKGNPFLQPQYANTLVLQYAVRKTTISASYTHTSDISSTITEVLENDLIHMIPRNIGMQNNLNVTVTQQVSLATWWNMSLTGMAFHLQNKVGTLDYGNYNRSRIAGTINVQQSFNLPGHMTAEGSAIVNSKNISALNTIRKGNSQIDIGLQKNIIQNKATLRLGVSDLFKRNKTITDTQLDNLILHNTFAGETRQVRLNFTYKFGNNKIKAKDSRQSGLEHESQRL